jgi:ABC-2 type transport system permease protein
VSVEPATRAAGGPPAPSGPLPEAGRLRSLADLYWTLIRTSMIQGFQYRVSSYFYMIGMLAEPVIYLVVWSTIARQNGGAVDGLTPGDFAAYFIVWTLVRQMNIVFTPYGWEWRIREGQIAGQLLKPMHPLNYDIGDIAGWKFVSIVLWIPIAIGLTLVFHPTLHPDALDVVVFFVAIWGAYFVRTMNLWALGLVSFWTTRVAAIFEVYFVVELLLSGRVVPLQLMPHWVQTMANFLPFKWTFGYPIESLTGGLSTGALFAGLGAQAAWTLAGYGLVRIVWRRALRRFTSVGN